ncbi:endonuclease III [Methanobrevibacter sp. 87.7]|uniref:endonuclease III domain-containing protein n=1 Tax=Methanobrevibacter sp. 87.7 TaxID=387957 RepID=UPI000B50A0B9|nr:hypothetical protein [Methanobrevibacter sp. 87.7]OWT32356.1 endonuclease III [Methanobrevibacter sp. 87.7]
MVDNKSTFNKIYDKLLENYSYQGWWPLINYEGINPTKTGSIKGYHPGDYNFPRNDNERFEIIIGAILTQNTSWPSVEKSLRNLNKLIDFNSENFAENFLILLNEKSDEVKNAIKPAGYYNQKFNYLINITEFCISLNGRTPSRSEILKVKGVGKETADSIRLFAYKQKEIIVSVYLKRILFYLGFITKKNSYSKIKKVLEKNFEGSVEDYQEFHSLIVEHAKHFYSKKPYGVNDNILNEFIL